MVPVLRIGRPAHTMSTVAGRSRDHPTHKFKCIGIPAGRDTAHCRYNAQMDSLTTPAALLDPLTSAQRDAVQHLDGPLMVLAGPGSGKTRVVTHRIAYLLHQDVAARQILALTFTNKAADEMRQRVQRLAPGQSVWMGTFHRFCARLLRQYASYVGLDENYTIYDTHDSLTVIKKTIEEEGIRLVRTSPERIAREISRAKNDLLTAQLFTPRPGNNIDNLVAGIYPAYQQRLLASNAVDFDDLLLHVAHLLRDNTDLRRQLDNTFRHILVDEYQDTNLAQYAIVRGLSADYPNISVTGDPDQSIYSWRGANLSNILEFENDYPNVQIVRLEQNYRSTQRILKVADCLITHNTRRKEKLLFTENDQGEPAKIVSHRDQKDEAQTIAAKIASQIQSGRRRPRDFAIFYRINALSRIFEQALFEQGIPYQIVNGFEFYQRQEIKDVLAYLHLMNNARNDVAFTRIINRPPRGIGKVTLGRIREHASRYGLSLLEASRQTHLLESLSRKAAKSVTEFIVLMDRLNGIAPADVEEILGHIISDSGYEDYLKCSEALEDSDRLDNIHELLSAARQFDEEHANQTSLDAFLEQVSLVSDTDAFEIEPDQVTLMTLHAAKGLEFSAVFIVAVEENLLPHERSRQDLESLEEERRLLFVGITRAQESLELSIARYRDFRGNRRPAVPSSFLFELPTHEMDVLGMERSSVSPRQATPSRKPDAPQRPPNRKSDTRASHTELMTAADMLAPSDDKASQEVRPSPDEFYVGLVVTHPNYQLGKVIALSGKDQRRTATVQFFSGAGQRKFVIVSSPLRPVKSRSK